MQRKIGIGKQDFAALRENQCFYIDKTDFIKQWWESQDDVTLITRPRRFGKTLNMSMLNCFFSNIDADHVFVMDNGKVVMEGTPRQIFSQVDKLKELRLDVPQVTELAYELKKEGLPVKDGIIRNEELVEEIKRLDLLKTDK